MIKDSDIFVRKARGTNISRQAQRVYLCFDKANKDDLNALIDDLLSQDSGMDCVVTWANTTDKLDNNIIKNEFRETQVLIVWVTNEFLNSVHTNGIPIDLNLAHDLHIPILPIAQDEGLLPIFTDIVGKLHGIATNDPEYRAKLKAQLDNFLASEELKNNIDSKAFTAEIFLSYRKADLDDARELMKDLHNVDGLQGISIWYDHFLTAGREFDLEIREVIENSKAFLLLVTPNITKNNDAGELNYVAREEVPFAIKKEKTIIPVEAKSYDAATFAMLFPNVGEPVSKSALNEAFQQRLGNNAYIKTLGSERAYLLGMAYLRGYKVERDTERAIKLFEEAEKHADKYSLAAVEQLAKIYEEGLGGNYSINYNNALYYWQKAASLSRRINGKKHQLTATVYNKIGTVCYILGEYKKALEFHDRAIQIYLKIYDKEHSTVGITYSSIGKVYIKLEKSLGITVLYDALKIFQKNYGENHPYTAGAYMDIGINHIENKTFLTLHSLEDSIYKLGGEEGNKGAEYALTSFFKALAIYKNIYGDNHYFTANAYNYIGKVYIIIEEYDKALEHLNIALKVINDIYGEEHLYSAFVYANLGLLYMQIDEFDKALYYFDKALKIQKAYFSEDNIAITSMYKNIGEVYLRFEKYDEALEYFIKDIEMVKKNYEEDTENKKNEEKTKKNIKFWASIAKCTSKGIWLVIIVFLIRVIIKLPMAIILLPVKIIKSIPKIIKFIKALGSLNKKTKNKSKNKNNTNTTEDAYEGIGADIYSMLNFIDKSSLATNTRKYIKEKYIFIADLFYKNKNYENALKYYNLAMEIKGRTGENEMHNDDENLLINIKISMLYMLLNNPDSAFEYCQKALNIYTFNVKIKMMHEKNKRKRKKTDDEDDNDNEIDYELNNTNTAELFNILGKIYYIQKNYHKALENYHKAIEIHELLPCETADTEDDINKIRNFNTISITFCSIAKINVEMSEFDKALMNYNKALRAFLYDKNSDSTRLNEILHEIINLLKNDTEGKLSHLDTIMIYYGANIVSIKINIFEKNIDINITINDDKDKELAELYTFAGNNYIKINNQSKALELFEKALVLYKNTINDINNSKEKDDDKKLEILKKQLEIEIKLYGEEYIDVAKTCYSIGAVYKSLDDHKKRLEFYKRGLEIRIKIQGEENADVATQYNNVAVAYSCVRDQEKALEYHNKALSIRLKIFGEENSNTASSYANIGYIYKDMNDHEKALENFDRAVNIYKKVSPKDTKRLIDLYSNIIKIQIEIYGEIHEKIATTQSDLGYIYFKSGNIDTALECESKSLKIRQKVFGDEHLLTATSYFNIGAICNSLKQYEKSLENYFKSLEIRKKSYGEEHKDIASSYFNIGIIYKNIGDYKEALDYCQKALIIRKKLFNETDKMAVTIQDTINEIHNFLI
ncbi:hypothetical protein AGMMS50293_24740 [Spirochaetia bacterium]|nr:hypothetical protein AGMMS50293_24740 [Spirochaetia bacterium]